MKKRWSSSLAVFGVTAAALLIGGCCSNSQCPFAAKPEVQRHGAVIGIPAESIPEYKRLHADTWPGVLKMIDKANIGNYSIYLGEVAPGEHYLFAYYEYTGRDFEADMAKMKKDKTTQEWWKHTDPLQKPLPTRKEGEWWAAWEEVFHHDGPAYKPSQIKLGEYLLFSYFEYIGDDFRADMADIADEVTKTWWSYTDPLQVRLPGTPEGEQWKTMEQVFHTD